MLVAQIESAVPFSHSQGDCRGVRVGAIVPAIIPVIVPAIVPAIVCCACRSAGVPMYFDGILAWHVSTVMG